MTQEQIKNRTIDLLDVLKDLPKDELKKIAEKANMQQGDFDEFSRKLLAMLGVKRVGT